MGGILVSFLVFLLAVVVSMLLGLPGELVGIAIVGVAILQLMTNRDE